jgi:hypothetical protein
MAGATLRIEGETPVKLLVLMPDVRECVVSDCAYNSDRSCHARAITVGDGAHAACDTYHPAAEERSSSKRRAGVGACKLSSCEHNEDLECRARSVRVAYHQGHADCVTYLPRASLD